MTRDGREQPVDTLIFATGFETTSFLAPLEIEGLGGRKLEDVWRDGAEAYLGMAAAGFPNLFMLYGPNTNLGHNSIIFMIECQVGYIVRCLRELARRDLAWLDVRPDVHDALQPRAPGRAAQDRLGRGLRQLVQDRVGEDHQQLVRLHRRLLAPDPPPRLRRLPRAGARLAGARCAAAGR